MADSIEILEKKLLSVSVLSEKIELLNELAWEYRLKDRDILQKLSEESYTLSTTGFYSLDHYKRGVAASLRNLCYRNNMIYQYDKAIAQALEAFSILETISFPTVKVDLFQCIGWTHFALKDNASAVDSFERGLALAQEIGDLVRQASLYNTMGLNYAEMLNYEAAVESFSMALKLYTELGDIRGEAVTCNNLALALRRFERFDEAILSGMKSLTLGRENNLLPIVDMSLDTLSDIYLAKRDYVKLLSASEENLIFNQKIGNQSNIVRSLIFIAKAFFETDRCDDSAEKLRQAIAIAEELAMPESLAECHEILSKIFEKKKNCKDALVHYKLFHAIREMVFNKQRERRLSALKVIHQVETTNRNAEIQRLSNIALQEQIEEQKKSEAELEELAISDPLTGLFNRRHFFEVAQKQFGHNRSGNRPVSVLLLDIDHFKQVNDRFGHAIGDQVLVVVSEVIRANLRQEDIVSRYGGEEFVVFLPDSNESHGRQVAERIRESLEIRRIDLEDGRTLSLTISIGVSSAPPNGGLELTGLIDLADQALYKAKQSGRNRVEVSSYTSNG